MRTTVTQSQAPQRKSVTNICVPPTPQWRHDDISSGSVPSVILTAIIKGGGYPYMIFFAESNDWWKELLVYKIAPSKAIEGVSKLVTTFSESNDWGSSSQMLEFPKYQNCEKFRNVKSWIIIITIIIVIIIIMTMTSSSRAASSTILRYIFPVLAIGFLTNLPKVTIIVMMMIISSHHHDLDN